MTPRAFSALALAATLLPACPLPARAQAASPFVGQIVCAGFNFAPLGWARMEGQLLPIAEYETLFALIGTTYGGDGQATFGLPDLRGRMMRHADGSSFVVGQRGGAETATLSAPQLPLHGHTVTPIGSSADATLISPANAVAPSKARTTLYAPGPGAVTMAPSTTGPAGGGQPLPLLPPYQAVNCFISLYGVFPSRS